MCYQRENFFPDPLLVHMPRNAGQRKRGLFSKEPEIQVHATSRLRLKASLNVDLNVYLLSLALLKFTVEGAELVNSFGRILAKRNDVLSPFLICGITSMNSNSI